MNLLREMGIDVWFERPTPDALARAAQRDAVPVADSGVMHVPENAERAAPAERIAPEDRIATAERTEGGRHARQKAVPVARMADFRTAASAIPPPSVAEIPPSATASPAFVLVDPFSLFCVKGDGLLLIAPMPVARTRQRLARDIVQAAVQLRGGDRGKVQTVEFNWPPVQGGASGTATPDRVLRAFLDRQLRTSDGATTSVGGSVGGHVAGRRAGIDAATGPLQADVSVTNLLICADAISRFSGWYTGAYVEIASLDTLYGDAGAKRDLWQRLINA